jgi:hypothetical protein
MKVNQIVGEHKKGMRAKKYARKPINAIAPKKPESPKGPEQANEDIGSMTGSAAKVIANDGKSITVAMPDGTQIQKPIGPNMLATDQQGKPIVNLSTQQPGQPAVPPATQQNPQDMFAKGKDITVNTGKPIEEAPEVPYFVDNSSGTPMAKTSPRPTTIIPSKMWTAITPEIEAKAGSQGFRKVMLQANGKQFVGLEGGDQKLGSKIIVSPTDYQALSAPAAVRESDSELARWKMIAGV